MSRYLPRLALALIVVLAFSGLIRAQATSSAGAQTAAKVPDLSGDWAPDGKRGGAGQSFSLSDVGGRKAGSEDDVPYQPWAREKVKSERPSTGPYATFENTTDPVLKYCDPYGVPRIYMSPSKTRFIQTPDVVYIVYEYGPYWRPVWLNRKHSEDPDPTWWGESIGWYENGDTLVVDSVGFNDKTWLDQVGHPHTEKMHLTERYRRVGPEALELDLTIDDPGAYTKPWNGHRSFVMSHSGFARYIWVCTMGDNQQFFNHVEKPTIPAKSGK